MAKRSGTTRSVGSSAASATRTGSAPVAVAMVSGGSVETRREAMTSTPPLPLSSEEKTKFAQMEALNVDAIARYNRYAKTGGILKQKASSDANKSRKAMDDIRYNRPAIMKTLKENDVPKSQMIGHTGSSTKGYEFSSGLGASEVSIHQSFNIDKIVSGFNKNGASVESVEKEGSYYYVRFKKRI